MRKEEKKSEIVGIFERFQMTLSSLDLKYWIFTNSNDEIKITLPVAEFPLILFQ